MSFAKPISMKVPIYRHSMADGLRLTSAFLVYTTISFYFVLVTADADSVSGYWVYYLAFFEAVRLFFSRREDPLDISMGTIFMLLFGMAGPGIYWLQGRDTTFYVALIIIFKDSLLLVFRNSYARAVQSSTNIDRKLQVSLINIACFLILSLVSNVFFSGVYAKLGFIAPFAVALVYFERYLRSPNTTQLASLGVFSMFALVLALYLGFFWTGFGRIRIGSYLMIPLLLLNFYRPIGVRTWQIVLGAPLILFVAQLSRYGEVAKPEQLFLGSAGVHITFTDELWGGTTHETLGGFSAWLDQWLLLLGNWVPDSLWVNKPIGIGYSSVDDWIGRTGFGEGYSISIGFIGEQYYLLGELYWLGLVAIFLTLVILRVMTKSLCRGYVVPLIMFDVNLMSYIWGGGGTFGSRLFFFLVPTVLFLLFVDRVRGFVIRFKILKRPRKAVMHE